MLIRFLAGIAFTDAERDDDGTSYVVGMWLAKLPLLFRDQTNSHIQSALAMEGGLSISFVTYVQWTDLSASGFIARVAPKNGRRIGWHGRMDGWTDGRKEGWTDGRKEGRNDG